MDGNTALSETIELVRAQVIEALPKATIAQMVGCFNLIKPEHIRNVAKFANHDVGTKRIIGVFDEATEIELADMLPVAAGQLGVELEHEARQNFLDAINEAKQTRINQEELERRATPTPPSQVDGSAGNSGEGAALRPDPGPMGSQEPSANETIRKASAGKKAAPTKKAAAPAAKTESDTAKRARLVKEFLTNHGPTTVKDLGAALKLSDIHVRNGIDALRRDKVEVFAHGGSIFALKPKGATAAVPPAPASQPEAPSQESKDEETLKEITQETIAEETEAEEGSETENIEGT